MVCYSSSFTAKVLGERGRRGIKSFENPSVKVLLPVEKLTVHPIKKEDLGDVMVFREHQTEFIAACFAPLFCLAKLNLLNQS